MARKFEKPKPLNPKQKQFLREYLLTRNASKAYSKVYKSKNPNVDSTNLMKHPLIQEAIEKHDKKLQEKFEVTEEQIINELKKVAFDECMPVTIGDILNWDEEDHVTLIAKENMKKLPMKYIKSIKQVIGKDGQLGVAVEMRNFDKVKALTELRRHIGAWRPKDVGKSNAGDGEDSPQPGAYQEPGESVIDRVSRLVQEYKRPK